MADSEDNENLSATFYGASKGTSSLGGRQLDMVQYGVELEVDATSFVRMTLICL